MKRERRRQRRKRSIMILLQAPQMIRSLIGMAKRANTSVVRPKNLRVAGVIQGPESGLKISMMTGLVEALCQQKILRRRDVITGRICIIHVMIATAMDNLRERGKKSVAFCSNNVMPRPSTSTSTAEESKRVDNVNMWILTRTVITVAIDQLCDDTD